MLAQFSGLQYVDPDAVSRNFIGTATYVYPSADTVWPQRRPFWVLGVRIHHRCGYGPNGHNGEKVRPGKGATEDAGKALHLPILSVSPTEMRPGSAEVREKEVGT